MTRIETRADRLPVMRNGQRLTNEGLRQEAATAVAAYSGSQSDLARVLDVHRSSISRAIHEAGSQFASLQIKIIQVVFPEYDVEKEEPVVTYRVTKKQT